MQEERVIDIRVRGYRSADESVVASLLSDGHLQAYVEGHPAAVLRSMAYARAMTRYRVFVAEADGEVIGATAILKQRERIAHLLWVCIAPGWRIEPVVVERLVKTATAHVREQECLKLIVHTALGGSQAANFIHHMGFGLARECGFGRAHVLEFYLDLYRSHGPQEAHLLRTKVHLCRRQPVCVRALSEHGSWKY